MLLHSNIFTLIYIEKPQSPGTLLLNALQGWQDEVDASSTADPYNSWFASVLLSHILRNNARAKAIALAITFGDEDHGRPFESTRPTSRWKHCCANSYFLLGEDPVSLIHAITASLMVAVKGQADVRVSLGFLALLCQWCYDSPRSIKDFLSESAHLQFVRQCTHDEDLARNGISEPTTNCLYTFVRTYPTSIAD